MREKMRWAEPIGEIVHEASVNIGVRSLFVGGMVRDAIIGRPNEDIDICVIGHPNRDDSERLVSLLPDDLRANIIRDLRRAGDERGLIDFITEAGGAIALSMEIFLMGKGDRPVVHTRFLNSTMTIDGMKVEMTGARMDDYGSREGVGSRARNPVCVTPSDEISDARRRDFTINAIFVDLSDWRIVDPTGMGIDDIERGIIRVTRDDGPEVVFGEDPLRILRAIRFSSQLGYDIDGDTLACIEKMTKKRGHEFFSTGGFVSEYRVRDELCKMLMSDDPTRALETMSKVGLLDIILPEIQDLKRIGHIGHKDIWDHTMIVMKNALDIPDEIRDACEDVGDDAFDRTRLRISLSSLLHDVGKVSTRDYGIVTCRKCSRKVEMLNEPERRCKCGETVRFSKKMVTFHDHHKASATMARDILSRLRFDNQMISWVSEDCFLHTLEDTVLDEGTIEAPRDGDKRHVPMPKVPIEKLINKFSSSWGKHDRKWSKVNELVRWHILSSDASGKRRLIIGVVSHLRARASEIQDLRKEEAETIRSNKPLISGDELKDMFGLGPGKWIGEAHRRMREDRLENPETHDRERAMEIARSVVHDLMSGK